MTQEAPAWPASCWRSARRAVAAAVVAGQVAAATTGVLPWPVMLLTSTLVVVALHLDELAVHAVSVVRTSAQLAAALAGVVGLVAAARAPDPTSAMSRMVILLAVLQVAAGAAARTRRDLHGVNVMAGCVVVGSAATLSDVARGLPAVAAWPVILVAASVVQRLAAYDSVQAVAQRSAHHGTGSPRRSPVAAAAVAALLVGLAGFLVLPGANAAGLRNRLSAGHGTTSAAGVGRATAGIDTTGTGRLDMSLRGKLPDAPVAVVSSASPKLWRGTTYDTYTGRGWFNSNPAIAPLPAS